MSPMFDIVDKRLWLASLAIVAAISFFISFLVRSGASEFSVSAAGWYLASVSTAITAVTLWHIVLTKWVWRWEKLRWWYIKCPNMSGKYTACLHSGTFRRAHLEHVIITHDIEGLRYASENPIGKGVNSSLFSRIHVEGQRCTVWIGYENRNANADPEASTDHEGIIKLVFLLRQDHHSPREMEGNYFTNKPIYVEQDGKKMEVGKGTWGRITLRKQ